MWVYDVQSYQSIEGAGDKTSFLFLLRHSVLQEDLKVPWAGEGRTERKDNSSSQRLRRPHAKDGLPNFNPWFRAVSGFYPVTA